MGMMYDSYLLRSNLTQTDPAVVWNCYLQLAAVEEVFRNLKGDLTVRPIFHRTRRELKRIWSSVSWHTICT
jgi:hypothetical protein